MELVRTTPQSTPRDRCDEIRKEMQHLYAVPRQSAARKKDDNDSEPYFPITQDSDSSSTVSVRSKRKRSNDYTDELNLFKKEIKDMFTSFQKDQEDKITTFLNVIKEQNSAVQKSIDFLSEKYDGLINKLDKLESEKKANMQYIQLLEKKVEKLERNHCSTSLEIRNVPKKTYETKENLSDIVITSGQQLKLDINRSDIKDVYRINTKSANKPIIVDFISVLTRDRFIDAFKKYNNSHKNDKFNTKNIQIDGPSHLIYISESLPSRTRYLFLISRKFAKVNNYIFCWTSHGKVYLRKKEGASLIRIESEADLEKIKEK
ncbi:unnamed protein product [Parnassius mnemosyne]|uniref:FP protein C-terminal domain-containing protein n=1 Tax=Parnassius mnemosyne TaxID=213953 RepID=A0AAV1KEF0_9NEOP